ncbi:MAG: type VI secretion system tip protein TssI/VgrG [Polyangiaceae bacterium]
MSEHRFLFHIDGCDAELHVVRFAAREGISELFHLEIIVATEAALSFADIADKPALLTMCGDDDRHIHGRVERLRLGDTGKRFTTYALTIVPRASRLHHRSDCRIFQELTAPQIIEKVLVGAGLASGDDFRLSLQGTYPVREYCVQYRETDFAFVSRLMEAEGIHYFFEHAEDKHVLVLADAPSSAQPIAGEASVLFRPSAGAMMKTEHIRTFHLTEQIRSGKVTVRDWNFTKPAMLLEGTASAAANTGLELYDFPNEYQVAGDGSAIAKHRLEERSSLLALGDGEGGVTRLTPGFTFTLTEHPREALNASFLVTRVEHQGVEPIMGEVADHAETIYQNRFECIPAATPFHPPLITPRPTIKGVQSAIVTGPAGEEIHTDEHGRVKVQFHWDRLGKKDDKSSCWMRVSQLWAGESWGGMFIPRVGHEVLVDFMDGDPDRPVIVGRVYHGTNVPPYALPGNKTRSTIKSNSTPGGGGSNELRFEDRKGSEEIYLHGQKDWTILIEHDKNQEVVHDETRKVGNDRTVEVGHDQKETIGNDETFEVKNDRKKTIGHDESESIGNDRTISVGNDHTESIANNETISIGGAKSEDVGKDATETIGTDKAVSVGKDYNVDVAANLNEKIGANHSTEVELVKSIKVGDKLTIVVGDAKITIEKSGDITVEGKNLSVKSSGDTKVESSGKVEVKATGDVAVESSGKVDVKSSGPMQVNASGPVKVKGAQVGIN